MREGRCKEEQVWLSTGLFGRKGYEQARVELGAWSLESGRRQSIGKDRYN